MNYTGSHAGPDCSRLTSEINASNIVATCTGCSHFNTTVIAHFDADLDGTEETTLAALFVTHDPVSIAANKVAKAKQIDARTSALIAVGFTYSGNQFSLSLSAQSNWLGVISTAAAAGLTYPYPVATIDNDYHMAVDEAEMITIATTAMTRKGWAVGTGATLKKSINDAADQVALDGIVDNRS